MHAARFRLKKRAAFDMFEASKRCEWILQTTRLKPPNVTGTLLEVVQKRSDTFKGRLALSLNLYVELDFSLADAPQVLDVV